MESRESTSNTEGDVTDIATPPMETTELFRQTEDMRPNVTDGNTSFNNEHGLTMDEMMTPLKTHNMNQKHYPIVKIAHSHNLDLPRQGDDSTHTPLITRKTPEKQSNDVDSSNSDVDPFLDISPFVKSSRYGQTGQKFRLFWLPNTEVSSLMRVPSIAQLSNTHAYTAEMLYIVYTPSSMDILQDVSDITGVEKRPFHTPFVLLYSYSYKSMYFKVVGRIMQPCYTITFGEDGEPATVVLEDETVTDTSTRRKLGIRTPNTNYAFYRSYLYGLDDDQKTLRVKVSLRNIKDLGLDMRDMSVEDEANNRIRASPVNRIPYNGTTQRSDFDNAQYNTMTPSNIHLSSELASNLSIDTLQFDGGVPYDNEVKQEDTQKTVRHGGWVYAAMNDHDGEDHLVYGLPGVLWTELKRFLGMEGTSAVPHCNLSMVNHRMEAMIKRNFELYDEQNQQLSADVKNDLIPVADKGLNSTAAYHVGSHLINVGDFVVVKFPSTYRGYTEEDIIKIYDHETLVRCFDTLTMLSDEGPTDLTIGLAQYCPNIFWNLVLGGDLDTALRQMAPKMYGTLRKRKRAVPKDESLPTGTRHILPVSRSSDAPIFDNNFVIMQNMFERDAQAKIERLEKIREQQRDFSGKPIRYTVSKYLTDEELIATVMDADGFLLKSMQLLTPEQKMVIYRTCLRRGLYVPVRLEYLPGKGRAVFAAYDIGKDEFIVEYKGHIITEKVAKYREQKYDQSKTYKGSFVFYFKIHAKRYGIDATEEDIKFGPARLINHSRKNPNVIPKAMEIDGCPRLFFVAKRDIKRGEELLIDYGERDPSVIKVNPWLLE
ncbi:histone lysine methyltransferase SET8 [Babesia ovis]|uniref:Histone lysine methyltransferase SET8 n=1 Tax=Babesia ovis TaxID=5869 RepID=A0A9W5T903_BABOV|nr:histone lysine methyltransferase SET8 [Babesia ovis]